MEADGTSKRIKIGYLQDRCEAWVGPLEQNQPRGDLGDLRLYCYRASRGGSTFPRDTVCQWLLVNEINLFNDSCYWWQQVRSLWFARFGEHRLEAVNDTPEKSLENFQENDNKNAEDERPNAETLASQLGSGSNNTLQSSPEGRRLIQVFKEAVTHRVEFCPEKLTDLFEEGNRVAEGILESQDLSRASMIREHQSTVPNDASNVGGQVGSQHAEGELGNEQVVAGPESPFEKERRQKVALAGKRKKLEETTSRDIRQYFQRISKMRRSPSNKT